MKTIYKKKFLLKNLTAEKKRLPLQRKVIEKILDPKNKSPRMGPS